MKRRVKSILMLIVMILSFTVSAVANIVDTLPENTVLIGNHAFSLEYYNNPLNKEKIEKIKKDESVKEVYIKKADGIWYIAGQDKPCDIKLPEKIVYKKEIPSQTVIIGNKAFSLKYANNPENVKEIIEALKKAKGLEIYIKKEGIWIKNSDGKEISIPNIANDNIVYKDENGKEIVYEKDLSVNFDYKFEEEKKDNHVDYVDYSNNSRPDKEKTETKKIILDVEKIILKKDDALPKIVTVIYKDGKKGEKNIKWDVSEQLQVGINKVKGTIDGKEFEVEVEVMDEKIEPKISINKDELTIELDNKNVKNKNVAIKVENKNNIITFLDIQKASEGYCRFRTRLEKGNYSAILKINDIDEIKIENININDIDFLRLKDFYMENNKVLVLVFNKYIANNFNTMEEIKNNILISRNNNGFNSLNENDSVQIFGDKLFITLFKEISGENNSLMLLEGTVVDQDRIANKVIKIDNIKEIGQLEKEVEQLEELIDTIINKELVLGDREIVLKAKSAYDALNTIGKASVNKEKLDGLFKAIMEIENLEREHKQSILRDVSPKADIKDLNIKLTLNKEEIEDSIVTMKITSTTGSSIEFIGQKEAEQGKVSFETELERGKYIAEFNIANLIKIRSEEFTVGIYKIKTVENLTQNEIVVPINTSLEDIMNRLQSDIKVTLNNETERYLNINWEAEDKENIDVTTTSAIKFNGKLDLPDYITDENNSRNLQAIVKLVPKVTTENSKFDSTSIVHKINSSREEVIINEKLKELFNKMYKRKDIFEKDSLRKYDYFNLKYYFSFK